MLMRVVVIPSRKS